MTIIIAAFRDGWGRVLRAPVILLGVFVVTLLFAVPSGRVVEQSIAESLGNSLDAQSMASGVNSEWWDRFGESATGIDRTFTPTIIGFGAVLQNLSGFLDNGAAPLAVVGLAAAYLLAWLFLVGGILDRYARMRPLRTQAFFSACGVFFVRFLRLAVIAALGYLFLFGVVHGWLFEQFYRWATRDLTVERTAFVIRVMLYAVFLGLLFFWNVVIDYAKVRAVVEDRRSMLGAMLASWRFVVGHPMKVGSLYLLNGAAFLLVIAGYALVAPGAAGGATRVWMGFVIGEVYLLARLAVKLAFYASETALFQRSLAHLAYSAAPEQVWPESPAAEMIVNAADAQAPSSGL
jgi:hypothetical protein